MYVSSWTFPLRQESSFVINVFCDNSNCHVLFFIFQAYCNFSIFVAVISFLIGAALSTRFLQLIWKGREESFFSTFVDIAVTAFLCLMLLISSLFVSAGSLKWCNQILLRFQHCEEAAGNDILKEDKIDTDGFYWMLTVAQFGNWLSFLGETREIMSF